MAHPWSVAHDPLPEKPREAAYGWVDEKGWHAATREALIARCRAGETPSAVWTPDAPRLQFPGEVPWLHEALLERSGSWSARPRTRIALAALGMLLVATWWFVGGEARGALMPALWLGLGALAVAALLWITAELRARQKARSLTPEEIARARAEVAHARWMRAQRVTYTNYLGWTIVACGIAQLLTGEHESIARAGIVPDAVRAGEWWRAITGTLLHAGPLHFLLNYGALLAFSRQLEVHTHRAYVPIVFLASAIGGSVASLVLPPETTSVGASGGILGLIGALIALGTVRSRHLPPHFTRSLWGAVGATALLGAVGFALIDNAGHLGGFVAGLACGALFLPHRDAPEVVPGRAVQLLGDACLGAIVAAAAWAILRMVA